MAPPIIYEISSFSDSDVDVPELRPPVSRRYRSPHVREWSEEWDEDYEYPDLDGIDDNSASETASDDSSCVEVGSNEKDRANDTSSGSSSTEDSDSDEQDLADELANLPDYGQQLEEDMVFRSEVDYDDPTVSSPGNEFQEDEMSNFKRRLTALETKDFLSLNYPPVFSGKFTQLPLSDEASALKDLIASQEEHSNDQGLEDDPTEIELNEFCVYRSPGHRKGFQGQFESLHNVASNPQPGCWMIDGVLKTNNQQRRFTGYIDCVSIGNYHDISKPTTEGAIWVRTEISSTANRWYRLREPAGGYRPLWYNFLWLADLTKYFIDFLWESTKQGKLVSLLDFKSNFWNQLQHWHGDSLCRWRQQREKNKTGNPLDLRQDVLRYCQFLKHEAYSLCESDDDEEIFRHPVWKHVGLDYFSNDRRSKSEDEKTIVTKNVAACFHYNFSHWQDEFQLLEVPDICPEVEQLRTTRRHQWGFPDKFAVDQKSHFSSSKVSLVDHLLEKAGLKNRSVQLQCATDLSNKIVVVRVYSEKGKRDDFFYAWVRKVISPTKIAIVWLFRPSETLCGTGFYPIGNELFFSSECNCEPVLIHDVVGAIDASMFSDRATHGAKLFVHSLFDEAEQTHLTADLKNLVCQCQDKQRGTPKKPPCNNSRLRSGVRKMQGLSLFSGAGLLDHAMATTGCLHVAAAIEKCKIAAISYKTNDVTNSTKMINDSVNACLHQVMIGTKLLGYIDCIIAGCPCQGFSLLNSQRASRNSQKNCSLLANTLSWFEVLLPAYGAIENVPTMDRGDPNPCEQAICHLVALGYQVRKILPTVSKLGGASSRTRLILMVAAPNASLPDDLKETHGDEPDQMKIRTCEEVISGLDPITNDTILNISNPDHRPLHRFRIDFDNKVNFRHLVERIPAKPIGLGLAQTHALGRLLPLQRKWFYTQSKLRQDPQRSKTLKRLNRHKPFKTVCTIISPLDAIHSGEILHFEQHRTISLAEARLAMDLPDWFLLAGDTKEQYKLIGNGVPWILGAAIGRSIGKA